MTDDRPSNNFHAVVRDAGGGIVDLLVDRDTFVYPPVGAGVWVVLDDPQWNLEGGAMRLLGHMFTEREELRAEIDGLRAALNEAQLRSIEASNPGIDMDEVQRFRTKTATASATETVDDTFRQPPITLTEPVYNTDGFGVGFRVVHPPGVECEFPPDTKRCSCGKMDLGVVK